VALYIHSGHSSGGKSQGPGALPRSIAAVGAALAVAAASLALSGPAQGIAAAGTGVLDARGFPVHYTDDSGLSLAICEDGSANCLGATTADLADTTDGEAFYWMATAELASSRGNLSVEFALEAAYAAPNEPMVFDRLRVRGDLTRSGTYTLDHPYGSTQVDAVGTAARNVNFTEDLTCSLNAGCAGRITNFLRSTSAPTGYLGGGETLSQVTGGTVRNDLVLRAPNGSVIGRTAQFAIVGKLAPGPGAALSTDTVDFGNLRGARTRALVVRNLGDSALSLSNVALAGAPTLAIAPASTCTAGTSVPSGGSCRVNLTYSPGVRPVSSGTLRISDNTTLGLHTVSVKAMTAAVASAPARVGFGVRRVRTTSAPRRIIVENTGVVPMRIRSVALGANASFLRRSGQAPVCASGLAVRPGRACAVYVAFSPRTFGPKTSALTIRSNAAGSTTVVQLRGRGR
jgi:hypothetical protein